jgi:uncharacterized membrane protein YbhN (UPF0104 family)
VGVLLARPALLSATAVDLVPSPQVTVGVAALLAAVVAVGGVTLRGRRSSRLRHALRTGLADVRAGLFSLGTLPGVVLLSVASLAGYLALFVVAARASGSHAALGDLLPLLVLGLLAMGLPLNVGGWGPREAVTTVAFGAVGFGAGQGLTVAVAYGTLSLIACLPGLGVLLLRRPFGRCPAALPAARVAGC